MRLGRLLLAVSASVLLSGCAGLMPFDDDNAAGYTHFTHEECVPYARRISDIQLQGDAYTWWNKAQGIYMRGHIPAPGAVLVLARTPRLPHGHHAVVTDYYAPREIKVTHTNWGSGFLSRRVTYERLTVEDVSVANDWSKVRFWNHEHNAFGFPYEAYGFIYNARPIGYGINPAGQSPLTVDMFGNTAPIESVPNVPPPDHSEVVQPLQPAPQPAHVYSPPRQDYGFTPPPGQYPR